VSFTLPAVIPPGESRRYPLERRLGGPQSRPRRGGRKTKKRPDPLLKVGHSERKRRSKPVLLIKS
jgi:hypothetical protein